jgi:hypothetical protein
MHFIAAGWRFVATGWRRGLGVSTVHSIATRFYPPKEPAMTSSFASKFAALSLAAAVTLSTLAGLNVLAHSEQADAAQWAQQQTPSAAKG